MKAAVYFGARNIRIMDMPEPVPGPDQVVVRVARNGICGSDLHTYVGAASGGASMHVPGVILGHEFAGAVEAVGAEVHDVAIGDVVAVAPIEWCGSCFSCTNSWPHLCRKLALYGGYREPLHGGLAARVAVSRRSVFPVPERISAIDASLTEPLAVALHAARQAPELAGTTVLVLGSGPIGLGVLQACLALGADTVVTSDLSPARRGAALALGAAAAFNPAVDNVARSTRDFARHGVDVVFDTTAAHAAFNSGVASLRPRGTMVSVAGWGDLAHVEMGRAMASEINIRYSMTYEPAIDFPATLAMLASGALDASAMISDHVPLERLVEDGLEELLHHADHHLKILIDPT